MSEKDKSWKDIGNLFLSWIVIAISGSIGLFVGTFFNEYAGYFVTSIIAVFITLLLWGKGN